ncbi:hypothetical protein [Algoriphagus boritolerans]|uniref:hypothetical protein n=1 Tax=Algoriphagus boritolerans TaxID=308111 RepID=UPI002FCE1555
MTQSITDCQEEKVIWRDLKKFLLVNLGIALILQVIFLPHLLFEWGGFDQLIP